MLKKHRGLRLTASLSLTEKVVKWLSRGAATGRHDHFWMLSSELFGFGHPRLFPGIISEPVLLVEGKWTVCLL